MGWIRLRRRKQQMRNMRRLGILLLFCVGLADCAHGIRLEVCLVDAVNSGFRCSGEDIKKKFFLTFDQGKSLVCASLTDIEQFVKACKEKRTLEITLCSYDSGSFLCIDPIKNSFRLSLDKVDNYFCLSPKSQVRMRARCKTP